MSEATRPADTTSIKGASEILGIRELPSMTVLVTAIAQPFAQLGARFDLPYLPLLVAALVSVLFAIYSTSTMSKAALRDCAVLIPLITLALFATSLGANNIISAAVRSPAEPSGETLLGQLENTRQQLKLANEQVALRQKQLDLQEEVIKTLIKRAVANEGAEIAPSPVVTRERLAFPARFLANALELVAAPAYAQSPDSRSTTPAPGATQSLEQVKRLEAEARRLEDEQRRLAAEQKRLQDAAGGGQQSVPESRTRQQLWRAW
jgi:hypothetical protein